MSAYLEAFADDKSLLVFDGRVLELFGWTDAHRIHVWQRPRIEFLDGKRPRLKIVVENGTRHEMSYDPARRPALEALDTAMADAIAQRDAVT